MEPIFEKHNEYTKYISDDMICFSLNYENISDPNTFPLIIKKESVVGYTKTSFFQSKPQEFPLSEVKYFYKEENKAERPDLCIKNFQNQEIRVVISGDEEYEDICNVARNFTDLDPKIVGKKDRSFQRGLAVFGLFPLIIALIPVITHLNDREHALEGLFVILVVFAILGGIGYAVFKLWAAAPVLQQKSLMNTTMKKGIKPTANSEEGSGMVSLYKQQVEDILSKKDEYLKKYERDVEYIKLAAAIDQLPSAYYRWIQEILRAPSIGKAPINPFVAAGAGNAIAGLTGAVAMGVAAQNAQDEYKERVELFDKQLRSITSNGDKLQYLIDSVNEIIHRDVIEIRDYASVLNGKDETGQENILDTHTDQFYKEEILNELRINKGAKAKELVEHNDNLAEISTQKCVALLSVLIREGRVYKSDDKQYYIVE